MIRPAGRARALARGVARLVVLGVLLPVAALGTANLTEPLASSRLELLQYLPYPVFLGPALLALTLSFLLGAVWRWMALLSLLLVTTAVMGLVIGRPDADTGVNTRFRLMTYNIKAYLAEARPGGFDALAREVAAQSPDLLVMQDAGTLASLRHADTTLAASIFEGRQVYEHAQYLVVSRFPLRGCGPGDATDGGPAFDFVRCTVEIDGRAVELVTAHLLSPRRGLNATRTEATEGLVDWRQNFAVRLSQAHRLAASIASHRLPLIVAGDLNAPEPSPVIRVLLAQGLRDAFSSAGRGYGYTLGHALRLGISFLRIDHILVSRELGVAACHAGGAEASEHRPVIADLLLQREPFGPAPGRGR